ncbi:MAG: FG-GAP-like repeat-containing protein, partial [Phycisphaerae bacterium]
GGLWDPTPNRLYRNLGDGTFEEVASELGVDDPGGEGFQASFVDYDLDGDVDLFNVNDRGLQTLVGNSLWRNNGDGTFTEVSEADSTGMLMFAMGLAIGDMDRNGWPDFYVTNITDNVLLMNLDGETFVDMADEYGVRSGTIGWGAMWFDMDNDGWLELYVCNAPPPGSQDVADRLYQCNHPCDAGSAPCCVDLAASLGLNVLSTSYGVTSADIDDDGDVDLLVVRPGGTIPEPPDGDFRVLLYINHADAAPNHWLKVRLAGPGTAFAPIGATVFVQDAIGWQQQSLVAGKCYKSQTSTDLHFGVGAVTLVSELKVLWPGGGETVIPNVPVDQTLVVAETAPPAPFVTGVTLAGPTTVADATTVTYTATATCPCQYTTGGDVTAAAVWSAAPPEYASFDASAPGVLVVHDVVGSQAVDISATVGSVTATMTVVIHDSAPPPSDTTPPVVVITTPTADSAMSTDEAVVTLGGTAWDDVGVTSVTWRTDAGAGGSCSGRTSWTSSAIPLLPGDNVITVTATDAAQHVGQDTLAVAYVPAAVLSVVPETIDFADTADAVTVSVGNGGGGAVSYTVSGDAAWVSIVPAAGAIPYGGDAVTHVVSVDRAGFAPGEQRVAMLTFAPEDATVAPVGVVVHASAAMDEPAPDVPVDGTPDPAPPESAPATDPDDVLEPPAAAPPDAAPGGDAPAGASAPQDESAIQAGADGVDPDAGGSVQAPRRGCGAIGMIGWLTCAVGAGVLRMALRPGGRVRRAAR